MDNCGCDDDYNLYYDEDSDYNNSDADDDYGDFADTDVEKLEKNYIILKESDIKKRLEDDISQVSNAFSISRGEATALLYYYEWNDSKLYDNWCADEEERRSTGLLSKEEGQVIAAAACGQRLITCNICYDCFSFKNFASAACGHYFCKICYSRYVEVAIDDGARCLILRCPKPQCKVVVDRDMIGSLTELRDEYKAKYERFLLQSFVEKKSRKGIIKWCPGKNCENVLQFCVDYNSFQNFDVVCDCSWEFCWNCPEEMHSPADCETVAKWIKKNSSESENTTWVLNNTKPCPRCKTPIEKNDGCMHMTCTSNCRYQFCWLCLGDWEQHTSRNYYSCNAYDENKGKVSKEDLVRERAKFMIERYVHYYERWATNGASRNKARQDLKTLETKHMVELCNRYGTLQPELKAVGEAWIQIIECRRVLRWSYAYGYYLPEENEAKKNVFEDLQGQAESYLERLHGVAEKQLAGFLVDTNPPRPDEFYKYLSNLRTLTVVTKGFFNNLVTGLQNGLKHQ